MSWDALNGQYIFVESSFIWSIKIAWYLLILFSPCWFHLLVTFHRQKQQRRQQHRTPTVRFLLYKWLFFCVLSISQDPWRKKYGKQSPKNFDNNNKKLSYEKIRDAVEVDKFTFESTKIRKYWRKENQRDERRKLTIGTNSAKINRRKWLFLSEFRIAIRFLFILFVNFLSVLANTFLIALWFDCSSKRNSHL